jgi:hypothetical protein
LPGVFNMQRPYGDRARSKSGAGPVAERTR